VHHHLGGQHDNVCVICHSPHAASNAGLLRGELQEVCIPCHPYVGRQMKKSLFTHPGTKKCSDCHEPHGSNRAAMLRGDGNAICDRCHKTQGTFTHPVGEQVIDPRTGLMVSCISCHTPMGSNYKYELKFSGSKDLCIQCHKRY
jgi:predicted CXXCH cytochrome family protein